MLTSVRSTYYPGDGRPASRFSRPFSSARRWQTTVALSRRVIREPSGAPHPVRTPAAVPEHGTLPARRSAARRDQPSEQCRSAPVRRLCAGHDVLYGEARAVQPPCRRVGSRRLQLLSGGPWRRRPLGAAHFARHPGETRPLAHLPRGNPREGTRHEARRSGGGVSRPPLGCARAAHRGVGHGASPGARAPAAAPRAGTCLHW